MEIRILGTGSGLPQLGKHLSSVYVRSEGKQYLLDCGEGTIYQLLRHEISENDLDAVVITHYHPDHVAGIFMLIQMLYLKERRKDLLLFVPEREEEFANLFSMFYTFPGRISFKLKVLPMSELTTQLPKLEAMSNDHLFGYRDEIDKMAYPNQMMAYSIRVNSEGGDFVYSSDICTTDSIAHLIKGAHTLLVDAGHPLPEQILKLEGYGLKRVLLTHSPSQELLMKLTHAEGSIFEEAIEDIVYQLK
jgi:glyoxylase-like metal-dependent hydrolase (beta-lactamase superfamily II)